MSIFPSDSVTVSSLIQATVATPAIPPLAKEYAWDFENNTFVLVDGKNIIVMGAEAVRVWIWKALKTPRSVYKAYTGNFGHDLEEMVNKGLSNAAMKSEVGRYLDAALLTNVYVLSITNISINVDGSKLGVTFTVVTIYGEVIISV